jgi:16S rRNA (adenine1518-N6/adenine1519-N6)-dimethyltransferase
MQKLGQHWMTSQSAIRAVVDSLSLSPGDTVIEIGPGRGALTDALIEETQTKGNITIIAIEKDEKLAEALEKKYAGQKNIRIIRGDVLEVLPLIPKSYIPNSTPYKLVGNIPYYITGAIIRCITELSAPPTRAVLTMQREVAERLAAASPHMNLLAAIAQGSSDIRITKKLPRGAFSPPPKVESAIVLFENIRPCTEEDLQYHQFIRRAFEHPRKTLTNNLGKFAEHFLIRAGLPLNTRAHELAIPQLQELAREFLTKDAVHRNA